MTRLRRARLMALAAAFSAAPALGFAFGSAGAESSPYLKLPMGARGTGMGEAFTGVADDAEAMYYNAAGLTQIDSAELLLMHDESFAGIRYEDIGLAVPVDMLGLNLWGTIGFSYTLVSIENTLRTEANPDGSYNQAYADQGYYFTSGDSDVSVSYAWQATKLYSVGATVKFLNEKVDTFDGWGVAADVGLFANASNLVPGLQAGMTVQNIGTSPTSDPLPVNFRVGIADKLAHPFSDPEDNDDRLTTDLDFVLPIVPVDGAPQVNFGAEYFRWFGHDFCTMRLGYRFPDDLGALAGMTVGCGLGMQGGGNDYSLDYTFVPYGDLGTANRVAINADFGTKPRVINPRSKGPLVMPTGLKAKPGDKSASLAWDPSPVRVDGYNVYMSYNPAGGQWYRVKSHDHHEAIVNKLYNGYTIYFAITSIRRKADGSWEESLKSEPVAVRPMAPGAGIASAPATQASSPKTSQVRSTKKKAADLEPPPLP
jgi:hypothetical protein